MSSAPTFRSIELEHRQTAPAVGARDASSQRAGTTGQTADDPTTTEADAPNRSDHVLIIDRAETISRSGARLLALTPFAFVGIGVWAALGATAKGATNAASFGLRGLEVTAILWMFAATFAAGKLASMVRREARDSGDGKSRAWLFYAGFAAVFAVLGVEHLRWQLIHSTALESSGRGALLVLKENHLALVRLAVSCAGVMLLMRRYHPSYEPIAPSPLLRNWIFLTALSASAEVAGLFAAAPARLDALLLHFGPIASMLLGSGALLYVWLNGRVPADARKGSEAGFLRVDVTARPDPTRSIS